MSKHKLLAVTAAVSLAIASCGENKNKQDVEGDKPQELEKSVEKTATIADASFANDSTEKIFQNYQHLRMALVNSDATAVQTAAGNLAENFSEELKDIQATVVAMAATDDIEKQRQLFADITEKVEPIFKENISDGSIYKQFCPMAFEGKGGFWLSDVDEIRNPYYGDKMLKCGKVTETITK